MPFVNLKCPTCGTDGAISFVSPDYDGPYRCWKCHGLFTVKVRAGELVAWEPLSDEALRKEQELKDLKTKYQDRRLGNN